MKTILNILMLLIFMNCKAQTITPLYTEVSTNDGIHANIYYKDIDNNLDAYIGTWQGTLGNGSLTIIFNKINHHPSGDGDYNDLLVGEYQYVVNGATLVDTFPDLMIDNTSGIPNIINGDPWMNTIVSSTIIAESRSFTPCPECAPNTRFIVLTIADPTRPNILGEKKMARFVETGIEKIRMRFNVTFVDNYAQGYTGPTELTIPEDSIWTLSKVN